MDKKRIAVVFLIVLSTVNGATAIVPMMPLFAQDQFGATPLQATLVIAAFYAAQFVAAPWLGKLSDRYGRRPILIVSQIGTIASYAMIAFAAQLGELLDGAGLALGMSSGLLVLYLARVVDGLTGGNVSVAEAYASDISTPKERARALGLVGGANGLGHIVGPALAGLLAGINLLAPLIGAAIAGGVTLLLTVVLLDESLPPESRSASAVSKRDEVPLSQLLARRPIALILSAAFTIGLYIATVQGTFSLYAARVLFPGEPSTVVVSNAGLIMTVLGVIVAVSQIILIKPLVGHMGEKRLVLLGSVFLLVSAVGIGSASSAWLVVLFVVPYAVGFGVSWPTLQSLMTRFGSEQTAGRLLGLFQSAFSLALILGPAWGGYVLEKADPRAIYYGGAVLIVIAIALSVGIQRLQIGSAPARHSAVEITAPAEKKKDTRLSVFRH